VRLPSFRWRSSGATPAGVGATLRRWVAACRGSVDEHLGQVADGEPGYPGFGCIAPVWKASCSRLESLAAKVGDMANQALVHFGYHERIRVRGNSLPMRLTVAR
jgi:hypothetical protein